MKKNVLLFIVVVFCFTNSNYSQPQEKLLISNGISDVSLPVGFETLCSLPEINKAANDIATDVITVVKESLSQQMTSITVERNDTIKIANIPFIPAKVKTWFPTDKFYFFGKNGMTICEFPYTIGAYSLFGTPKLLKTQNEEVSYLSDKCEYLLVIWPYWWYHFHRTLSTSDQNKTFLSVIIGLYSVKSNQLLFLDYLKIDESEKTLDYNAIINKTGEKISKAIVKYFAKTR